MKPLVKYILNIKNPWIIAVKSGKKKQLKISEIKKLFFKCKKYY